MRNRGWTRGNLPQSYYLVLELLAFRQEPTDDVFLDVFTVTYLQQFKVMIMEIFLELIDERRGKFRAVG